MRYIVTLSTLLIGCGGMGCGGRAFEATSSSSASSSSGEGAGGSATVSSSSGTGSSSHVSSSHAASSSSGGGGAGGGDAGSSTSASSSSGGSADPCPSPNATSLAGASLARDVVTDGVDVFYANQGNGSIAKVSVCGGTPVVLATGQPGPFRLAVDGTNVYWTAAGGGALSVAPKSGGGSVAVLAQGTPTNGDLGLALDATSLYWNTGGGSISRVPLGGGAGNMLISTTAFGGIVVDTINLYWPGMSPGMGLWKAPLVGGAASNLAGTPKGSLYVAEDATNVYWTEDDAATSSMNVKRIAKAGGVVTTLASGQGAPHGIATDGVSVFWGSGDGTVKRCPVGGGASVTLATAGSVWGVALDTWSVYFADVNDTIGKVSK